MLVTKYTSLFKVRHGLLLYLSGAGLRKVTSLERSISMQDIYESGTDTVKWNFRC